VPEYDVEHDRAYDRSQSAVVVKEEGHALALERVAKLVEVCCASTRPTSEIRINERENSEQQLTAYQERMVGHARILHCAESCNKLMEASRLQQS
jgi:hypothetical protein